MAPNPHVKPAPKQIQQSVQLADAAHAQIYPTEVEPAPDHVETPATVPPDPANVSAPPPAVDMTPAAPETPPAPAPEAPNWEERYKALQGKYNSEISDYRAEVQSLQQGLMQLTIPTAKQVPLPDAPEGLTQEEIDEFGPGLVDVVRKVVRAEVEPRFEQVQGQIGGFNDKFSDVQVTAQHQRRQRFDQIMDQQVPGWLAQNEDPQFIAWLQPVDIYAGKPRLQLLQDAFTELNAERVAAFFLAYRAAVAAQTPQQPAPGIPQALPTSAPPAPGARPGLETLAAPGTPGGSIGVTPAGGQKPTYRQSEIAAFFVEAAKPRGQWATRKEEAERIKSDMMLATREGRVLPN